MILAWLILIPVAGGLGALIAGCRKPRTARWFALTAALLQGALAVALWLQEPARLAAARGGRWLIEEDHAWVPEIGASLHLGLDGLSLLLILLTGLLGFIAVGASWRSVTQQQGFFYLNLCMVLAGVTGVFLAVDLLLFYFFWELMLVPMYFLIAVWGHENRHYAAVKFFVFTQLSGLLMLMAILALYSAHGRQTGEYTFDLARLTGTHLSPGLAMWLMLGFSVAFAVKLPAVPAHTWLPDAHTEAPTAGSVLLAGLLLKTGAYGFLRFVLPLFPGPVHLLAPAAMAVGAAGVLYGALLAFAQTDMKRLVAYTSISHLGFVLMGIFAGNPVALQGAVMQMIAHGISTGALFVIVGFLDERLGTRDLRRMGGLWQVMPRMGAVTLIFALASLGLPGLGNFVGEFLVLVGVFRVNIALAAVASGGLILSTVYAVGLMRAAFFGPMDEHPPVADLRAPELALIGVMVIVIFWLGLVPQRMLDTAAPAIEALQRPAAAGLSAAERGDAA